jgi:hypothetical protein
MHASAATSACSSYPFGRSSSLSVIAVRESAGAWSTWPVLEVRQYRSREMGSYPTGGFADVKRAHRGPVGRPRSGAGSPGFPSYPFLGDPFLGDASGRCTAGLA